MKIQYFIEKYITHMVLSESNQLKFSPGAALLVNAEIVATIPSSTLLTTPAISRLPQPLIPNATYQMTHLFDSLDPSAIVIATSDGFRISLAVEDFLNAFCDNEVTHCVDTHKVQAAV